MSFGNACLIFCCIGMLRNPTFVHSEHEPASGEEGSAVQQLYHYDFRTVVFFNHTNRTCSKTKDHTFTAVYCETGFVRDSLAHSQDAVVVNIPQHRISAVGMAIHKDGAWNPPTQIGYIKVPAFAIGATVSVVATVFMKTGVGGYIEYEPHADKHILFMSKDTWRNRFRLVMHYSRFRLSVGHYPKENRIQSHQLKTGRSYHVVAVLTARRAMKLYVNGILHAEGQGCCGMQDPYEELKDWSNQVPNENYVGRGGQPDRTGRFDHHIGMIGFYAGEISARMVADLYQNESATTTITTTTTTFKKPLPLYHFHFQTAVFWDSPRISSDKDHSETGFVQDSSMQSTNALLVNIPRHNVSSRGVGIHLTGATDMAYIKLPAVNIDVAVSAVVTMYVAESEHYSGAHILCMSTDTWNSQFRLVLHQSKIKFLLGDRVKEHEVESNHALQSNRFYHIAALLTWRTSMKLYINGVLDGHGQGMQGSNSEFDRWAYKTRNENYVGRCGPPEQTDRFNHYINALELYATEIPASMIVESFENSPAVNSSVVIATTTRMFAPPRTTTSTTAASFEVYENDEILHQLVILSCTFLAVIVFCSVINFLWKKTGLSAQNGVEPVSSRESPRSRESNAAVARMIGISTVEHCFPVLKGCSATQCSVCLAPVQEDEPSRQLQCAHIFHADCILHWFVHRQRTTLECPVCRQGQNLEIA